MLGIVNRPNGPGQSTSWQAAPDGAPGRSPRIRVLLWLLVAVLAALVWALPSDPLLTRHVLRAIWPTQPVGVGAMAPDPPPGFRLSREATAHLQKVAGERLEWPVLLVVVLDDCGGCSDAPPLRAKDFAGWRAGSVVVVAPAVVRESDVRPSVPEEAVVVSDRVSSWAPTSIGYQLGPYFSPRAFVMEEGWVSWQRNEATSP